MNFTVDSFLELVISFLNKTNKNHIQAKLIYAYLFFMKDFSNLIKKQSPNHFVDYLKIVATHMDYEFYEKNTVLCRYGDKGKKAFIVLKGNIDILIKQGKKVKISEKDYFIYLATLVKYKEFLLLSLVLKENYEIFPVEIVDEEVKPSVTRNNLRGRNRKASLQRKNSIVNKVFTCLSESLKLKFKVNSISTRKYTFNQLLHLIYCDQDDFIETIDSVSSEEYISRLEPYKIITNDKIYSIEVNVYSYTKIISKGTGSLIGEIALSDPNAIRTATMITSTHCHFGTINKKSYNMSIKNGTEQERRANVNFVISLHLFSDITSYVMSTRYFNNFTSKSIEKGQCLLYEREEINKVFLIKDGEFEISFKNSMSYLDKMLDYFISNKNLGESKKSYEQKVDEERKRIRREIEIDNNYIKFYNETRHIKILTVSTGDIVGLDEYFTDKGESFFTVECKTTKGEVFQISKMFYDQMRNRLVTMKEKENEITSNKCKKIIERLFIIKKSLYKAFCDIKQKKFEFPKNEGIAKMVSMKNIRSNSIKIDTNSQTQQNDTSISIFKKSIIDSNRKQKSKDKSKFNSCKLMLKKISFYPNNTKVSKFNHTESDSKKKKCLSFDFDVNNSEERISTFSSFNLTRANSNFVKMNDMIWENLNKNKLPKINSSLNTSDDCNLLLSQRNLRIVRKRKENRIRNLQIKIIKGEYVNRSTTFLFHVKK